MTLKDLRELLRTNVTVRVRVSAALNTSPVVLEVPRTKMLAALANLRPDTEARAILEGSELWIG